MDKTSFEYNTLSIGGYSVIGARARAREAPPRARTPPHMTSEVMLSVFIRTWGTAFIRVCTACVTSCCDVMHLVCTASNSGQLTAQVTTLAN